MTANKVASFFAGIGGFDLGFEQQGFKTNFQCEIQDFCNEILGRHWPNVAREGDILSLQPNSIPKSDVWCGGFPCQDLSVARGSLKRHGLNGKRSGLFYRFAELADANKPRVILLENVHGLLSANGGKDFATLLQTFDEMGYAVAWRLLNSRYFGSPQSRPRVYICAWRNNPVACGNVLFEERAPAQAKDERSAFLDTSWQGGAGPIVPRISFCLAATSGRHTGTDWSRTYVAYKDAVRRLTPLECERLQGFPDKWTELNSSHIGVERSDSLRYHALGNAVSVTVVRWAAGRIRAQLEYEQKNASRTAPARSRLVKIAATTAGLSGAGKVGGKFSTSSLCLENNTWPTAGLLWRGEYLACRIPPSIHAPVASDLLDLIEKQRPDGRYFLSANAAEGILRRVDSQSRHLFPHLRSALEQLSGRLPRRQIMLERKPQLELRLLEAECA